MKRFTPIVTAILISSIPGAALAQWSTGSGGAIYYNGGIVGIGTTNPQALFDIATVGGNTGYFHATSGTNNVFHQFTNAGGNAYLGLESNVGGTLTVGGLPYATVLQTNQSNALQLGTSNTARFTIIGNGNVGIGTTNPQHLLHVAGTIGAEQIIVSSTGADYVFDPNYKLAPLSEVASYVEENHHLPGIPSAEEMTKQGVSLGDLQTKLLAKIEELTLHMIKAEEKNGQLEKENRQLEDRVAHLEAGKR